MLHPGEVRVARRGHAVAPAHVVGEQVAAPVAHIERRIRQDGIGAQVAVQVAVERVGGDRAEIDLDAANGEGHLAQLPGGRIGFLAEDGHVVTLAAVRRDETLRLHEHAARSAARVVDAALVGFEHLDQQPDDGGGRVELAALLAFAQRELAQEVLVDFAENVLRAAFLVAQADGADEIHQFAQSSLVERGAGVIVRQHALEARIVALDGIHRAVDQRADFGALGIALQVVPARVRRHPEHALGQVLVAVFGIGVLVEREAVVQLGEGVRDVLQENEAEHDVFVVGAVEVAAQLVSRRPQRLFKAEFGSVGR